MPQTLDFVLQQQFTTLEFYNFQVIDRGVGQAIVDFAFECLMLFFEFRKVRLHRHAGCLLNQWLPDKLSLAQTRRKGDDIPGSGVRQMEPKAFDWRRFFCPLECACGKRDNYRAFAETGERVHANQR
jgi:hypothetical protein